MYVPTASLKKFAREAFVSDKAMKVKPDDVAGLMQRLTAWLAANDSLALQRDQTQDLRKTKLLGYFVTADQQRYSCFGYLQLDANRRLFLTQYSSRSYPVGSVDEVTAYLALCRDRVVRMQGQAAKRAKVRKLRGAAVLARIHDLARKHRFDFAAKHNSVNVDLAVRFGDGYGFEVTIPVAKLDELLPQLETTLPLFRDLFRAADLGTLRARLVPPSYSRRWVRHQDLGPDDPNPLED